mmetsp:Transcript_5874/g.12255  ORF Transcript_5874/g.12255 Transcript_5874/m.12255 type:complete len:263 (-) Transcript_5874:921-1709(-)
MKRPGWWPQRPPHGHRNPHIVEVVRHSASATSSRAKSLLPGVHQHVTRWILVSIPRAAVPAGVLPRRGVLAHGPQQEIRISRTVASNEPVAGEGLDADGVHSPLQTKISAHLPGFQGRGARFARVWASDSLPSGWIDGTTRIVGAIPIAIEPIRILPGRIIFALAPTLHSNALRAAWLAHLVLTPRRSPGILSDPPLVSAVPAPAKKLHCVEPQPIAGLELGAENAPSVGHKIRVDLNPCGHRAVQHEGCLDRLGPGYHSGE